MEVLTSALTRSLNSELVAVVPGVVFLAAMIRYGHFEPKVSVSPKELIIIPRDELVFKQGVLMPHEEYLYGYSEASGYFVAGTKLPGFDYSAWEAEYMKFGEVNDAFNTPDVNDAFAITDANKTPLWFIVTKLLLWLLLGIFLAFILRYLARKVLGKIRRRINEKMAVLLRMYGEAKAEILSLSKLTAEYYDRSRDLKQLLVRERQWKGKVVRGLMRMKAEHAKKAEEQQREIQSLEEQVKALQSKIDSLRVAQAHHHDQVEVFDSGDENAISIHEQDEDSPASEDQIADPKRGDDASELEDKTVEEELVEDRKAEEAVDLYHP